MNIFLRNTIYREAARMTATDVNGTIPLVLVHAFPIDHRMWDECARQVVLLADKAGLPGFAIWAPDMPGAGGAAIPDAPGADEVDPDGAYPQALDQLADAYAQLLRDAGYERAVWVGLSMGGYVVLDIQRRHPQMVAGLALCDTKAQADSASARANRLAVARDCEEHGRVDAVMHFAQPQPGDSSVKRGEAFVETFARWIGEQDPRGVAWRQRMAAGRPDLSPVLASVQVPSAVMCGDVDPSSDPEVMRPIAEAMTASSVRFSVIEDCGHFSAVEHPERVAALLVDLMRRVYER